MSIVDQIKSLHCSESERIPACRKRSGEDGRMGGGEQRAGPVGDQMSSQWGRNSEVRDEGGIGKGVLSSCLFVYIMFFLYNMLINQIHNNMNTNDMSKVVHFCVEFPIIPNRLCWFRHLRYGIKINTASCHL